MDAVGTAVFGPGGMSTWAKFACVQRFVDIFGKAAVSKRQCVPPLADADRSRIQAYFQEKFIDVLVTGLKSVDPYVAETEYMNFLELAFVDVQHAKFLYEFLQNCL